MSTSTRLRALVGAALLGGSLLVLPGAASAAADARTCDDFDGDQPAAQQAFEADRTALADLDRNHDGIACNSLLLASSQELLSRIVALQCGADYAEQVQALRDELTALATTGDGGATNGSADDGTTGGASADDGTTGDGTTADGNAADASGSDDVTTDQDTLDQRAAEEGTELSIVLDTETAALNNCAATDTDVDPTASDGSVPITDGGQVSVVPEGSAATGEA